MEPGGEAEPHPHLLDAPGHSGRTEVGHHAEGLEHIGGPHGRRRRPAAVLADLGSGGRHHQGGDGRHVDAGQPVATGAAGVDHVEALGEDEGQGVGHHGADEAGHLLDRLALGPQGHQERGHLGRGGVTRPHLVEDHLGLVGGQRGPRKQGGQDPGPRSQGLERAHGRLPHPGQSHHRSWPRTPRAMRPSCTCEVPSTMVSCLASRYQSSVGWSSMYPAAPRSWTARPDARTASSVA